METMCYNSVCNITQFENSIIIIQTTTNKIHYIDNHSSTNIFINNIADNHKKHIKQIIKLEGKPGEGYYLTIFIGTPPQKIRVLIDTGSSNFAIAAYKASELTTYFHANKSHTLYTYNVTVEVPYTQGNWEGNLASDIIEFLPSTTSFIPSTLPAIRTKLSLIERSENFFIQQASWEGILGLAYPRLAKPFSNLLSPFDQYIIDGYIDDIFSLQLCSNINSRSTKLKKNPTGSIVFGGLEHSMYIGDIYYTPIVRRWYYEVIMTSIKVNNSTLPINCQVYNKDRTIIDSGTTNFRLEQQAFKLLINEMKQNQKVGMIPDDFWLGQQYMCWDKNSIVFAYLPTIKLSFLSTISGYFDFELHITPQMYLREVMEDLVVDNNQNCYRFAISPSDKATVVGAIILEGFYVVFDRENNRIGFALTNCGSDGIKNFRSDITGPKLNNYNLYECHSNIDIDFTESQLSYMIFVLLSVIILSTLPIIFYLLFQFHPHKIQPL